MTRTLGLARLSLIALLALALSLSPQAKPISIQPHLSAASGAWTVYHNDNAHTGSDPTLPPVSSVGTGWVSPVLDAQIYASPLVFNGNVYTATLNDSSMH